MRAPVTFLLVLFLSAAATRPAAAGGPDRDLPGLSPGLLQGLASENAGRRRAALAHLLELPDAPRRPGWRRAERILAKMLRRDPDPRLRGLAARCLYLEPSPENGARIARRFSEERNWRAQRGLMEALEGFTDPGLLALLERGVFDSADPGFRALQVEALGRAGGGISRAFLLRIAKMSLPWPVTQAVAAALARQPVKEAVDRLLALLESGDAGVRSVAFWALVRLTGNRDLPARADAWARWWAARRAEFRFPGRDAAGRTVSASPATVPTYHDIPIRGRRIVFCLDVSASMWGPKFEAARAELSRAVRALPPDRRFAVITFNEHPRPWRRELVPARPFQKIECLAFLDGLTTKMYTNLYDTLELALGFAGLGPRALRDPPGADDVFLLTDGEPNRGRHRDREGILRALDGIDPRRRVRIHTISIGDAPRALLRAIAARHGGRHVFLPAKR